MHASSCPGNRRDPLEDRLATNNALPARRQKVCSRNDGCSRIDLWKFVVRHSCRGPLVAVFVALVIVMAAQGRPANAQNAQGNASLEGEFGWIDAVLATPNYKTPVSPDDILATAPGVEEETPRPQFNLNILAPVWFNSNAQFLNSGGTSTMEG